MIAGTGLPKYQVEQAAKADAGRIRRPVESHGIRGAPVLLPQRHAQHGARLRSRPCARSGKAFSRAPLKVLSLLFKIWIVAMLVGLLRRCSSPMVVLAIVAVVRRKLRQPERPRRGGGTAAAAGSAACTSSCSLFDLILRMWFWSNLLGTQRRKPQQRKGRAFYKSVFGFVFGEGDPNKGWEEAEKKYVISYIRSHKGVITLEELMALTGQGERGGQPAHEPPPARVRGRARVSPTTARWSTPSPS